MYNQFRQIYLSDFDQIPLDKPILIAANHPTAFLDPVLIGVYADPPIYFMTRGDLFKKPRAKKILELINMFPVNRQRDGFSGADRMEQTNEYVFERLREQHPIGIFVEGQHHLDRRIIPLQKGVVRLAFGAYERFQQPDLQVLPIGLSFRYGNKQRDTVSLLLGKPIFVKDYWEQYLESPAKAAIQLLHDIRQQLIDLSYHVEKKSDDDLVELLLRLHQGEQPVHYFPVIRKGNALFYAEKSVVNQVNEMEEDAKKELQKNVKKYFKTLKKHWVDDAALLHPEWSSFSIWIVLALAFPFFLLGWLFRLPSALLANFISTKKVKKKEFKSSVFFGIELLSSFFLYLIYLIIALFTMKPLYIGLVLLAPIVHPFALMYRDAAKRAIAALWARLHPKRSVFLLERSKL
jgi:1-acyl-sn-glycerol-3-phosphate acyltransferase